MNVIGAKINGHSFLSLSEAVLDRLKVSFGFSLLVVDIIKELVCIYDYYIDFISQKSFIRKQSNSSHKILRNSLLLLQLIQLPLLNQLLHTLPVPLVFHPARRNNLQVCVIVIMSLKSVCQVCNHT